MNVLEAVILHRKLKHRTDKIIIPGYTICQHVHHDSINVSVWETSTNHTLSTSVNIPKSGNAYATEQDQNLRQLDHAVIDKRVEAVNEWLATIIEEDDKITALQSKLSRAIVRLLSELEEELKVSGELYRSQGD
jgi:hypothetical protein